MKGKKGKQKVHGWQEKQKKMGRRAFTVFLDGWIIDKVFARAKLKNLSVAEYMNKYMPAMWAKVGSKPETKTKTANPVAEISRL
jgi:hypothetical protein